MKKSLSALALGLLLASSAQALSDADFNSLLPSRTIASVEPGDLEPTHVEKSLSLFELGLGAGTELDPHYPGSDQSQWYAIPYPFAVYRGRILRSDKGGTRAQLLSSTRFDLSVSGAGAFPVRSADDAARSGMNDLGWMGQLGPKLRIELKTWDDGAFLRGGLSARAAASADDFNSIMHRGFVYEAELVYQKPNAFGERFDFFGSVSSIFASEKYMDYLYGVAPGYATATRGAYESKAGYLESNLQAGLTYRSSDKRQTGMISLQAGTLEGAANLASPLVRSRLDFSVGFAWVWTLFQSEEKAVFND